MNRVQQTLASRYDPTLPSSPFGNWLTKVVGPQSGVSWRLGECVERNGTSSEWDLGVPACVEATAILPDDRKVVAQIHVGSFKQMSVMTKFHFAVIENDSQFHSVRRLSDLPQLLRTRPPRPGTTGKKQSVVMLPQLKLNGAPKFYYAKSAAPLSPPQIASAETSNETPPPPAPAPAPRVSKGVTTGEVVTKVQPTYPSIAKQINAAGGSSGGDTHQRERAGDRGESHQRSSGAPRCGGRRGAEMGLQTDAPRWEAGEAAGHSDLCFHRSAMRLVNIVAARKAS